MIKNRDVTICMVHFNRPTLLAQTLPSWLGFDNVFVWDNNSVAQNKIVLKAMEAKNKNLKVFWNPENVGWPKALNQMIIHSKTDWFLIVAEDMLLGRDFWEKTRHLLEWKPNLEQIYLYSFDAMLFHKKTVARFGWWEERQNFKSPTAEDDDWYLRLVEHLGYSPYVYPGEHIQGPERVKRLKRASTQEIMERMDNISYWANCRWGISSVNYEIKELTRDKDYHKYETRDEEPGLVFHRKKWEETDDESDILNKDGTFWKRRLPDEDFYPEIREKYKCMYLG
jgi:glycosyltransferase involved in cell wall biosynthesis